MVRDIQEGSFKYRGVERRILDMVDAGTLKSGERLPSLRSMAAGVGVSIATVTQAYAELEKKGLIEARPRSGYFLRSSIRRLPVPPRARPISSRPQEVTRSGIIRTVLETVGNPDLVTLSVAHVDPRLLPAKALNRIMAQMLKTMGDNSVAYDSIHGNRDLRHQIAFRAGDLGIDSSPDDFVITNGAMEALYIALRATTKPGDTVVIQSPTYFCLLQLLETLGLRAIEIPSDPETGVNPADVADVIAKFDVNACAFNPNFNNPDGAVTPDAARAEIVRVLTERDIPLIEDDVFGDIYHGPARPGTYKRYDTKDLVIHCSSFSKTLAPGYRAGWMIPGRYVDKALEIKATTNVCNSLPTQVAVAEYLRTGHYDRHLRRLRGNLLSQMRTMQEHIARHFPADTRMTHPSGGTELWLELPGVNTTRFFHEAKAREIGICPGVIFSTQDKYNNFVRISCGNLWSAPIKNAVEVLGELACGLSE